jgi:UDP-N-acetylmuramyl tripeptide synthase
LVLSQGQVDRHYQNKDVSCEAKFTHLIRDLSNDYRQTLTTGRGQTSKHYNFVFREDKLKYEVSVPDDPYGACLFDRTEGHRGRFCMRNVTRRLRDDVTGIREVLHIRNVNDSQQIIQDPSGF